ncbi:MAG: alpha/beta hydrolase [Chloroflexi bacterium]|nr:MAG: alpha/beta hydrolase [Chloroflexota bacterium]
MADGMQRTINTPDGRSLDVYLAGPEDGMPLLYHGGTPSSGLPYPPFVEALAQRGLRYVSWNRPGYGSSTRRPGRSVVDVVDDARSVLQLLGADRFYTLGWSGGGPHALACAARLGEGAIGAATIGGVAPYPAEGLDWMAGMGAENVEEFAAALAGPEALIGFKERAWPEFRAVTGEQLAAAFGDLIDDVDRASLSGEFPAWLAASMRAALREHYWGWFDDDLAFARPWGFALGQLRVPVHIWQGAHDRMVPFGHGEWLAAHIPTACPHLLADQGHLTLAVDSLPQILDELLATSRGQGGPGAASLG